MLDLPAPTTASVRPLGASFGLTIISDVVCSDKEFWSEYPILDLCTLSHVVERH